LSRPPDEFRRIGPQDFMETIQMQAKNHSAGDGEDPHLNIEPPPPPPPCSKLSAARAAVELFLATELGAREIRVTKIAPVEHGAEGWSAEAEVLVPNLAIKTLGLPLTQEILEQEFYLVELNTDLVVRSFESLGPISN
jgi:hypothetical protein